MNQAHSTWAGSSAAMESRARISSDGGRMAFLLLAWMTSKRPSLNWQQKTPTPDNRSGRKIWSAGFWMLSRTCRPFWNWLVAWPTKQSENVTGSRTAEDQALRWLVTTGQDNGERHGLDAADQ